MTRTVEQIATHALHARRKRTARATLQALRIGAVMPPGMDNLVWSLPQDVGAALHQVDVRLSLERAALRRNRAGAWYIKPNPYLIDRLRVARIALRWLRRNEFTAFEEATLEAAE